MLAEKAGRIHITIFHSGKIAAVLNRNRRLLIRIIVLTRRRRRKTPSL
jgi:hypothetical protein